MFLTLLKSLQLNILSLTIHINFNLDISTTHVLSLTTHINLNLDKEICPNFKISCMFQRKERGMTYDHVFAGPPN